MCKKKLKIGETRNDREVSPVGPDCGCGKCAVSLKNAFAAAAEAAQNEMLMEFEHLYARLVEVANAATDKIGVVEVLFILAMEFEKYTSKDVTECLRRAAKVLDMEVRVSMVPGTA